MARLVWLLAGIVALCIAALGTGRAETYGNLNTMGVVVDCPKGSSPKDIGKIKAFLVEGAERREVHDFVQVASAVDPKDYFATSLFYLRPDTQYTVQVEYYDREGKLISTHTETGRTRPEPRVPETARAIYASPGGDDRNPGTLKKPFRSLRVAFAALAPGTALYLRQGTYYEADLTIPRGGAAGQPIVIRSFKGERAMIDGSDPELLTTGWQSNGDGIFSAPSASMTWNVTLEERSTGKRYRCYPLRTLEELAQQKSAGMTFEQLGFTGAYFWDGKSLHLRLPKGKIEDYLVHVGRFTDAEGRFVNAIMAKGCDHVVIDGLEFQYVSGNAVGLQDSSEVLIQNCTVSYCNAGVWVKGNSSNNTIQDCSFIDDTNHWSFGYAKTEAGWYYHGQVETGAVCVDARYSGRGLVVRRNHIAGVFDGSHLCPWVQIGARTSETDFYQNEIKDVADDFIETDGYSRNVRIFENRMDGSLSGISLAQALDGPTWVMYNIIANCGVCVATQSGGDWGYPIKTNGGDHNDDMGTGYVMFYHNTAYTRDPGSFAFLVKYAMWRGFRLRNNIWCGKAMGVRTLQLQLWPTDWDYDDVYHESGPFAQLGDRVYPTLDEFRKGRVLMYLPEFGPKGIGEHLVSVDPGFENADGGDYRLRPGSPCADAGVVLPGINDKRYQGKAPDLGALESDERKPAS